MKEGLKSNKLIAISGVKSSGKDTSSKMLQYCLSVPKIFRQY
jgi:uridine kinase